MRRLLILLACVVVAGGLSASAGAYGGGASHDMWQIGISGNCDNSSSDFCLNSETGQPELGGFWGWIEFDRFADGTITGDAQQAFCFHTLGGGGAGAGHADVDITSAHIGPAQPDDPNYPGGHVFYVDHNVTTFTGHGAPPPITDAPDFLGDSGIPVEPGHYSSHPAAGVAFMIQVAFRPAK
jgi:hypothetical protein